MLAGGVRDFITPAINGLLARDERELSNFIAQLAMDAPLRRFMANRNLAEPYDYDWRAAVRAHRAIYDVAYDAAGVVRDAPARASHAYPGNASATK